VGLFATIGVASVLTGGALAFASWWILDRIDGTRRLPGSVVLLVDLRGSLNDAEPEGLRALPFRRDLGLSETVLALDRAANDVRVRGLVARVDDTSHGFAGAQELREAVRRFGETGKTTLAFAASFGELGPANEGYYLATGFDQVVLQPIGLVGLTGLSAEVPFFKPLLDRLGIVADVEKREAYKTAFDSATETGLTPANREMLESMLGGLSAQLVDGIAQGRKLDRSEVQRIVDGGPYDSNEAVARRLVDRAGYWDEVLAEAERTGSIVRLVDYVRSTEEHVPAGATPVAFFRAQGLIVQGRGGIGAGIAADDTAQAIADAVRDRDIRALLVRVDSPGGSAVGSETVGRQIRRAVQAGKPVIIAMGNAAASGGYWISMNASRIIAQPGTLTGSIGVIAGKPVLAGLWEKLGVNWAQLKQSANADMWSLNAPFNGAGQARMSQLLDSIYGEFKAGVASGRNLPPERVDEIAKGRVWLGSEAVGIGLVDELGGLHEAQNAIRQALRLPSTAALDLRPYPPEAGPFERLAELVSDDSGWLSRIGLVLEAMAPALPAQMPPLQVR
jgi:protease-4